MIDDEMAPAPSRAAVVADLQVLATDFGRLFATDCECRLTTDRAIWPSRYPEPADPPVMRSSDGEGGLAGAGLEVQPLFVRSAEDAKRAEVFYDRSGRPWVNSLGEPTVVAPGWADVHLVKLRGPGALRAAEVIDRANAWVFDSRAVLAPILWPGKSMTFRSFCWPDVVAGVADLAGRSTLKPSDWYVTAAGQSYSLMVWRRRVDFELGGPMVPSEVADRIGDEPENIWAKRPAFLRDSETAAQWLIDRLAEPVGDEIEPDDPRADCSFDPDSRALVWFGESYSLTRNMADVVGVLFKAWECGRPEVSIDQLRNSVDASALDESLGKVFQRRIGGKKITDPVWGVIESVGQGVYRLADPKAA